MMTTELMGICADCGGFIVNVNAGSAVKDGWERWECGGCHRHVSIKLEGTAKPLVPPAPVAPKVTP